METEIYEIGREMDELAGTILSGYKKKCLYEMKACKNNGGRPLSDEERSEADRLAAENLKQRYIRDQRSLLDTLEAERERQRAKLIKAMAKKRGAMTMEELDKILQGLAMDRQPKPCAWHL